MEFAAFVTLRLPSTVLALAGTELAEVFGSLGDDIFEQLHLNPSKLLP